MEVWTGKNYDDLIGQLFTQTADLDRRLKAIEKEREKEENSISMNKEKIIKEKSND